MSEGAAGNPTGAMMEAAFAHHALAWRYVNLEVAATALSDAVRGSRAMGFRGFNCSMPHKVAVIEHLDGLAASASVIGAVNCVVRDGERLVGHNTDGEGFLRALGERVNVRGTHIVVLGAGGAARAIAVELGLAGCAEVTIINRDEARGTALAELVAANTSSRAVWNPWIGDVLVPLGTDVLVNATSVGLYAPDDRPAIDIASLGNAALVADVVFNPVDTRLLRDRGRARLRDARRSRHVGAPRRCRDRTVGGDFARPPSDARGTGGGAHALGGSSTSWFRVCPAVVEMTRREQRPTLVPALAFDPDDAVACNRVVWAAARRAEGLVTPRLLDDLECCGVGFLSRLHGSDLRCRVTVRCVS